MLATYVRLPFKCEGVNTGYWTGTSGECAIRHPKPAKYKQAPNTALSLVESVTVAALLITWI